MTLFQIIMLLVAAFFAYKIFQHIMELKDEEKHSGHKDPPPPPKKAPSRIDPEFLVEQADSAYKDGDLKKALASLEEANAKDRNNPDIMNRLAFVLAKEGESEEAIRLYQESLAIQEDDIAHNALASLFRQKGKFEEAKKHYEAALKIDSEYAITYYNYANLLVDMGDLDSAMMQYELALRYDPDFKEAKEELKFVHEKKAEQAKTLSRPD